MLILRLFSVAFVMLQNGFYTCYADIVGSASDPHPHPDPDVLASDLLEWARANGAYINAKLEVKRLIPSDPTSPRGVFATDAMDIGETICLIPPKLILGLSKAGDYANRYCDAIKAVVEAMSGDDMTPYARYLLVQPNFYTPKFWSQASRDLLINMLESTRPRLHQLTVYDELPPHGVYDNLEEFEELIQECHGPMDDPLYSLYLQATMLVFARSDDSAMVPIYDMLNHHNGKVNTRHEFDLHTIDETGHKMVTTEKIQAGDEIFNSYNHCSICQVGKDWFGTPEIFLRFGFVESMPQRWLFDFARVKFDLDWKDGDETTGELAVNFLVPPSEKSMHLLQEELTRLDSYSVMYRKADYEGVSKYGISKHEWDSLWQYYDALHGALSNAIQSDAIMSDFVWDLDDDWWVKDGLLVASDDEHFVLPTISSSMDTSDTNGENNKHETIIQESLQEGVMETMEINTNGNVASSTSHGQEKLGQMESVPI